MKRMATFLKLGSVLAVCLSLLSACGQGTSRHDEFHSDKTTFLDKSFAGKGVVNDLDSLNLNDLTYHSVKESDELKVYKRLASKSDYICRARVLRVTAKREKYDEQAELVMSRIKLEILENWKGQLESGTEIRSFGGVIDGVSYVGSHFPRFFEGEEVVLFLANFEGGIFPVEHVRGKLSLKNGKIKEMKKDLKEFKHAISKKK